MIIRKTPTLLEIHNLSNSQLALIEKELTYTDKAAEQAYQRFRKNRWYLSAHGEEAYNEEVDRLKSEITKCLIVGGGLTLQTYSGLQSRLEKLLKCNSTNKVEYNEPKLLPWKVKPEFDLRYYQKESLAKLLEIKHGGIEIATGLGKTNIILHLVKELGLQTLILAPSTSIAEQIYDLLSYHFGNKYVGKFYSSKKEFKKLITVALPQSLIRLDEKSEAYKTIKKCNVFIADESHLCPAKTLADVCFGLAKNAEYRFFFSATQMRNDGKDLLLEAITGPIVYTMTARQGVDQGFLSKPIFKMVKCVSDTTLLSEDANELTRHYLYYNDNVNRIAGDLTNKFVEFANSQVLILIDEVEQFSKLLPYIKESKIGFAHGPLGENKSKVPQAYWESDPNDLVKQFNQGSLKVLIGTSCISTGTDIKTAKALIYLQGGKSEIQVKQAIGRSTRLAPGKTECVVIDFDVVNCPTVHRHAILRREIYDDIYGPIEEIDFGR